MLQDIQRVSISASAAELDAMLDMPADLRFLHNYWKSLKGGRIAPGRAEIYPEDVKRILPNLLLLDVIGPEARLKYRLAGSEFVTVYGAEVTGRFIDEMDFDGIRELVLADYRKVAKDCIPSWTRWSFVKDDGRWVAYDRLALPLSSDGLTVDMILAGIVGDGITSAEVVKQAALSFQK